LPVRLSQRHRAGRPQGRGGGGGRRWTWLRSPASVASSKREMMANWPYRGSPPRFSTDESGGSRRPLFYRVFRTSRSDGGEGGILCQGPMDLENRCKISVSRQPRRVACTASMYRAAAVLKRNQLSRLTVSTGSDEGMLLETSPAADADAPVIRAAMVLSFDRDPLPPGCRSRRKAERAAHALSSASPLRLARRSRLPYRCLWSRASRRSRPPPTAGAR